MTVFGASGSGKTSLMAKVAQLVPTWYPQNISPVVVTRLLGKVGLYMFVSSKIVN